MAVDVSRIPNNNKFDPVREAILDLQTQLEEEGQIAYDGTLTLSEGTAVTLTGGSTFTANQSGDTTITIGVDLSVTTNAASGGGSLSYLDGEFTYTPPDLSSFIELTDLSITTSSTPSGGGALSYDDTTGVFTFTPADAGTGLTLQQVTANGNSTTYGISTGNITVQPSGTGSGVVTIQANSVGDARLDLTAGTGGTGVIKTTNDVAITFEPNATEKVVIASDGNMNVYEKLAVGKTTAASTYHLEVDGTALARTFKAQMEAGGTTYTGTVDQYNGSMQIRTDDGGTISLGGDGPSSVQNNVFIKDGDLDVNGDVTADFFIGDGSQLTNIAGTTSDLQDVTDNGATTTNNITTGNVKIYKGDSGQTSPNSVANGLIIEDDSANGISILTPSTQAGNIFFGDENDNYVGGFRYFHTNDSLTVNVNNALALTIDASQIAYFESRLDAPTIHINSSASLADGTNPDISTGITYSTSKVVTPKLVFLNDAAGDDNYITCDDNNNAYSVNGQSMGAWYEFVGDKLAADTNNSAGIVASGLLTKQVQGVDGIFTGSLGVSTTVTNADLDVQGTALIGNGTSTRADLGLTLSTDSSNTFVANTDLTDTYRQFTIINDNDTVGAYSSMSFRVYPSTGTAMADIKLVRAGTSGDSTLYTTIRDNAGNFKDIMAVRPDNITVSGDLIIDHNTGALSHGVIFRGVAASAGEVGIRANGEAFEIYEPEQANKVWLSIADDPEGNGIAAQLNSPTGFTPILTNYNKGDYITKTYIDGLNVDADTLDGLNSTQFLRSDADDTTTGTLTIQKAQQSTPFTTPFLKLYPAATTNLTGHTTITLGTSVVDNYGVSLSGWRYGTDGDPKFRIKMHNNSADGVDALTINSSGNVGIGTTSPSDKLQIDAPNSQLRLRDTDDGTYTQFSSSGNLLAIRQNSTTASHFWMNSSGNVGLGTNSPSAKLQIVAGSGQEGIIINNSNGIQTFHLGHLTSNDSYFQMKNNSDVTEVLLRTDGGNSYINTGNVGIGTTDPKAKLHTNQALQGSLLSYINGTAATFDGSANFLAVHNSPSIGNATGAGLVLANNDKSNNAISPLIAFSAKSSSNTYNHTYAGIYGVKTGGGADSNWVTGDLVFATNVGTGINERVRIKGGTGNVGIGTTSPSVKLDVAGDIRSSTGVSVKSGVSNTNSGIGATMAVLNDIYAYIDLSTQNTNGSWIDFSKGDGTDYGGRIRYVNGSNRFAFFAGGSTGETLSIINDRVGINRTSPAAALDVGGSFVVRGVNETLNGMGTAGNFTSCWIRMNTTNTVDTTGWQGISFDTSTAANYGWSMGANRSGSGRGSFRFYEHVNSDAGTERFTLQQDGNVGIGDSTPSYKLDVNGTIRATGDVIAYSDARVKENVKTIDNALDKVTQLRGVSYNKIGETEEKIGVIAQEIEKVLPQVVQEDSEGMKSVAYGNIVGVLIEAMKEQQKQIDELKAIINGGT